MSTSNGPRRALPNYRAARIVGIFNVLFAAQLLVCGVCMGGYVAVIPLFSRLMSTVQEQTDKQFEKAREQGRAALAAQEKAATTVEAKALARARLEELEKRPKASLAPTMDMNQLGLNDPVSIAWSWGEVVSGLVLNVMLLASGIGLMHWKPWARTLGVATAALKVVRLVVLYGIFIVVIVPPISRGLGEMVVKMAAQQQAALPGGGAGALPSATFFTRTYAIMYSAMGVGMIVLGSVYPAIVLWQLTRPGVRSACSGAFLLPKEPGQP